LTHVCTDAAIQDRTWRNTRTHRRHASKGERELVGAGLLANRDPSADMNVPDTTHSPASRLLRIEVGPAFIGNDATVITLIEYPTPAVHANAELNIRAPTPRSKTGRGLTHARTDATNPKANANW